MILFDYDKSIYYIYIKEVPIYNVSVYILTEQ